MRFPRVSPSQHQSVSAPPLGSGMVTLPHARSARSAQHPRTANAWFGAVFCLVLVAVLSVTTPVAAQTAPFCTPGQAPAFEPEFATLEAQLGTRMGDPVECGHNQAGSSDILQTTSTGLAYYRSAMSTAVFTDGQAHYAWTPQGLIGWDGPSVDGPLRLALSAGLPTWCDWGALSSQVTGFLCAYPDSSFGAWYGPPGSDAWQLLGVLAGSDSDWQLTEAGRQFLMGVPPQPVATLTPTVPRPLDSDLDVSLDPVSTALTPGFPMVSGRACNRSLAWTATDVRIDFAFYGGSLLPTNDHGSYSIARIAPDTCEPFLTSLSALYSWQTIKINSVSLTWGR
jgi:hypothetical protein